MSTRAEKEPFVAQEPALGRGRSHGARGPGQVCLPPEARGLSAQPLASPAGLHRQFSLSGSRRPLFKIRNLPPFLSPQKSYSEGKTSKRSPRPYQTPGAAASTLQFLRRPSHHLTADKCRCCYYLHLQQGGQNSEMSSLV